MQVCGGSEGRQCCCYVDVKLLMRNAEAFSPGMMGYLLRSVGPFLEGSNLLLQPLRMFLRVRYLLLLVFSIHCLLFIARCQLVIVFLQAGELADLMLQLLILQFQAVQFSCLLADLFAVTAETAIQSCTLRLQVLGQLSGMLQLKVGSRQLLGQLLTLLPELSGLLPICLRL